MRHTDSDTNVHANSHGHRDVDGNANCDGNTDSIVDGNGYAGDIYTNSYRIIDCFARSDDNAEDTNKHPDCHHNSNACQHAASDKHAHVNSDDNSVTNTAVKLAGGF